VVISPAAPLLAQPRVLVVQAIDTEAGHVLISTFSP
jgi:hypothetical protein